MADEDYVVSLPRPASVKEWSDVDELLIERAEQLRAALGADWQAEGPLFEGGESHIDLYRPTSGDLQQQTVEIVVSIGIEPTEDELPPDPLPIHVSISQVGPAGDAPSNAVLGAILVGGAAVGAIVWRAIGGVFLPLVAGVGGLVALRIAVQRASAARAPSTPSPELGAIAATVKAQLPPG